MQRRRFFVIGVLMAFTGILLAVWVLTRDSGPPVVVQGNFSARDIAQIQRVVRRRLWHDALPNLSKQSLMAFPGTAKYALNTHVFRIERWNSPPGSARALFTTNELLSSGYVLTNGPAGWRWADYYFYIVPD